ncbi:hypothetical protein SOV_36810 [Sporomusa ovata DSM 2662]|nr:hypothetical protein SOV_6c02440 [Sporomusa ovata DSM 2662]
MIRQPTVLPIFSFMVLLDIKKSISCRTTEDTEYAEGMVDIHLPSALSVSSAVKHIINGAVALFYLKCGYNGTLIFFINKLLNFFGSQGFG